MPLRIKRDRRPPRLHGVFRDRAEAGRLLAEGLREYLGRPDLLVLGIPRGGVPVAFEVARALHARLDVAVVRKLGFPGCEELAMGAIASGGVRVLNPGVVAMLDDPDRAIEAVVAREQAELERRERVYRSGRPASNPRGRVVILVDDGLATGASMRAAATAMREAGVRELVIAVPVGAADTCVRLQRVADRVICLRRPEPLVAIGEWYADFRPTTDDEVRRLLDATAQPPAEGPC